MKTRDRAQRQLDNIRFSTEKNGRVPVGMRIKVKPDEDILFYQKWADALCQTEDLLANCIEQHLEKVIEKCDDSICDKVNNTLEIINEDLNFEGDPFDVRRTTLTVANEERQKINESIKKRKRENTTNRDREDENPPKKRKSDST